MEGFWPVFFLMVILKIPVGALLYLVWWAFRASTMPEEAPPEADDHRFRRFRREPPRRPRGPRRGPHSPEAVPLGKCPPGGRSRALTPPSPVRGASAQRSRRGAAHTAE